MGSSASLDAKLTRQLEQEIRPKAPDGLESLESLSLDFEIDSVVCAGALGRLLGDRCSMLKSLNFQGVDLGQPEILDAFGMGVGYGGLAQLRTLILAECELSSIHAAEALGHLLRETCPLLEALDLQGNHLGGDGALAALVATLDGRSPRQLHTVNLSSCGLSTTAAATSLGHFLVQIRSSLRELTLANNSFGSAQVTQALFEALQPLESLTLLDMKRCGVNTADSGMNVGLEGVRGLPVEEAMLRGCGIFVELRGAAQVLHHLLDLQLWDCVIGSEDDAGALGQLLALYCPVLQTLNLSGSNLGYPGLLDAVAAGLDGARLPLTTLWLEECGLDSAPAAHSLGRLLSFCMHDLKDLRLSYNSLGGYGILVVFGTSLGDRGLPALERLDLRNNEVDATEAGVRRLLPRCPVLRDIWGCRQVTAAYE